MDIAQPAAADAKKLLRREAKLRRDALNRAEVERLSDAVAERFFTSRLLPRPGSLIMGYLSFRNEVRAETILARALAAGYRVVLPYSDLKRRQLVPYLVTDLERQTRLSHYGMREPAPSQCQPARPDEIALILVPGLAFDERGRRLGYGGGFYDRFVAWFAANRLPVPSLVALAFELQVVDQVPAQPHDVTVDYLLTEKRLLATSGRFGPGGPGEA